MISKLTFCFSRDNIKKRKGKQHIGSKYLQSNYLTKDFKQDKELSQLNNKINNAT